MAPFSIPTPSIIPLRLPRFGGPKSIDTKTKIEILCETYLDHEIFYTIDGTRPQPYAGIIQGNKTIKYVSPFCLPAGKITIKAIAINSVVHTMCSSVVTKCFDVLKVDSEDGDVPKTRKSKSSKPKTNSVDSETNKCSKEKMLNKQEERSPEVAIKSNIDSLFGIIDPHSFKKLKSLEEKKKSLMNDIEHLNTLLRIEETKEVQMLKYARELVEKQKSRNKKLSEKLGCEYIPESESHTNCLEEAFIGSTDFELDSNEDGIEDGSSCYPVNKNKLDINDNHELSDTVPCNIENLSCENDSVFDAMEKLTLEADKNMNPRALTDSGTSIETQFCCLKCDLTVQQCSNCNKMNAMSSKFCIECGEQLLQVCHFCKEWNPVVAIFCQFCGKKLGCRMEPYLKLNQLDQSVMAKPETKNVSTEVFLEKANKSVQTQCNRNSIKRSSSSPRKMPLVSPGRGYWHQQLDFICNHLKSHAYNNVEFRREISEPSLSGFKSARIVKEENSIVISLSFTPFLAGEACIPASENIKTEDKHPESS